MRFGICPCCTVSNTGVFDAYVYNDYLNGGTAGAATYKWFRMASVQPHGSVPPGERYYSSLAAPFYWYVDLRDDIFVNYGNNIMSIAPLNTNNEPVWIVRNESLGERQLFGSYNNLTGTGWTIGPDTSITGQQLLSNTNSATSGVYITQRAQISGADAFHSYEYNFFMRIANDFQKTFLITVPNIDVSDGYYLWINLTGTGTTYRKSESISGGLFFPPTISRAVDSGNRYTISFSVDSEFGNPNTGTDIKIQIVDGTGLFTLSNSSGLGATIYDITYAGDNSLGEFYDGIHPDYDIVLVDAYNQQKRTLHKVKNNYYFSPFVSGSDMARYTNMTGNYWDEYTLLTLDDSFYVGFSSLDSLFQFSNFNNYYDANASTIDGGVDIFPRRYETFAHAINSAYTKSGFFSSAPYVRNTPNFVSCINSSGTKFAVCAFPSYPNLDTDDDYIYKNNVTGYEVSNFSSRFQETGTPSIRGLNNYDFIIEIDSIKITGAGSGLPSGLQAHWPLQDTGSTTSISALVGPTGSVVGGRVPSGMIRTGPTPIYPSALAFDGISDYIEFSTGTDLLSRCTGMTMMMWLNPNDATLGSLGGMIYISDSSASTTRRAAMSASETVLELNHSGDIFNPTGVMLDGWHHYAGSMNLSGDYSSIYRDGVLITGASIPYTNNMTNSGNPQLIRMFRFIGGECSGFGAGARVYSGVLSDQEILNIYNYELGVTSGITSTTGEINFLYGERCNWGQVETDQYITGQLSGNPFNSGPIGNIDTNLPRINMMSAKDYPNCWSVIAPKQQFATQDTSRLSISGAFAGHYSVSIQTGTLVQDVKIFYGPVTGVDYPVYFGPNRNIESGTTYSSQSGSPGNVNQYFNTGTTSEIFRLNRHLLHGTTGEVFWQDSVTGTRLFYAYQNTSGRPITALYNSVSDFNIGVASGLMVTARPMSSATILWGDTKKGIRAGIFTHTRVSGTIYGTYPYYFNDALGYRNSSTSATISGAGSPTQPWANQTGLENLSGVSYVKVKIGNNTVFDKQVYSYNEVKEISSFNYTYKLPSTTMPNSIDLGSETTYYERQEGYSLERARGLCAINDTESAQTIGGTSGIGFAWFERLWQTEPSFNDIEGVPTGWRLHVTDMSGNDIWSLDTPRTKYLTTSGFGTGQVVTTGFGPLTGTGNFGNIGLPTVLGSSNRFIYINGFFLCDERVSAIDEFGIEDDGCAIYKGLPYQLFSTLFTADREPISGAGWSWAISHDGLSKFPIKVDERQHGRSSTVFCAETNANINDEPDSIPVKTMGASNGFNLIDFVKDTTNIPYCPSLTQWGTASCNTGSPMYYVNTGVWLASGEY